MKKSMLAASIALAFGATAAIAGPVTIDRNGTAPGGSVVATSIVWATGNLLFDNMIPAGPTFVLEGHHTLASFQNGSTNVGGAMPGTEITMVYSAPMVDATFIVSGNTSNFTFSVGGGVMAWFYDDFTGGGVAANAVSGLGYGDGKPILLATFNPAAGPAGVITVASDPLPLPLLDAGPNVTDDTDVGLPPCVPGTCPGGAGVLTQAVTGSVAFTLNILAFDPAFFPAGIATTGLMDVTYTATAATPFKATEPSDIVGFSAGAFNPSGAVLVPPMPGGIPYYGEIVAPIINDQNCGNPATPKCDLHTAGTADTVLLGTFVPEPGSVALLGLGLGILGVAGKRRRAKAS